MPDPVLGVKGIMLRDAGVEPDLLQERAGYTTRALHPSGVLNPALPDETLSAELHPGPRSRGRSPRGMPCVRRCRTRPSRPLRPGRASAYAERF